MTTEVSSPFEPRSRRGKWIAAASIALVIVLLGSGAWYKFFRQVPQPPFASPKEQFLYGSIGAEDQTGIPYWIFYVLPRIFPEYLPGPGGYASLGFAWQPGHDTPAGFSKKTIGFERIAINCAVCHTGTFRKAPGEPIEVLPAGAGQAFDILAYQRFLFACASDERFNADRILSEIATVHELSFVDRLLYRFALIPLTRRALLQQKEQFAWTDARPNWGRGRIDPFNPVKVMVLDVPVGDTVGNSDMVPIWNLGTRDGMNLHWDGLNDNLQEVLDSSAIGDGATPKSLPADYVASMREWLRELRPPPFPWLDQIDTGKAARGEEIYRERCVECHADHRFREGVFDRAVASRVGKIEPVANVGTDRNRIDMWTPQAAKAYNAYSGRGLHFERFRSTDGYVNVPLDGLWARAPYLHNGSVPTLRDLLEPPERRPATFYRGSNLYDPVNMGFVSSGDELTKNPNVSFYDTSERGNANAGHLWGTDLSDADKDALLEYLKRF